MIAGAKLAAWLADRERQGRSKEQADALARRWARHPLYTQIEAELDAMKTKTLPGVLAAAERFMSCAAEIDSLFADLIGAASADPYFQVPLAPVITEINTGYLLFAHPSVTIGLGVISVDALAAKRLAASGPSAIAFTGLVTSYRFLKGGGATVSLWETSRIDEDFVSGAGLSCRFAGRRRISDGEVLVMDGRWQSLVVEHLESDMLCLQATAQVEGAPLSVDFDSRTLRYMGATSTDEASSRTQMMVTLLRLMDRPDAIPVIEQALASPRFYTRWHVMREMLALDAEAALPSLRRMAASDPHPEVRFAATQALSLFFDDEEEEALACRA